MADTRFGGNIVGAFILSLLMGASSAVAATTTSSSETAPVAATGSIEESAGPGVWSNIGFGLFGWTRGNGVGRWDGRQTKADGSPGDPVEITNQISVTYPTNIGMDFVVMPQFTVRPLLTTADKDRFELLNPTVGIVGTVMQRGGFSWWARFDNALPVTATSRRDGMVINPCAVNSVAYRFSRSGWEVQTVLVPTFKIFSNGEASSFLYVSPRLNYIVDDSWTVFGILETATETKRGAGLTNFVASGATNLGAGVKYSFSDLYLQPYLNIQPFNPITDKSMFIGMMFGGRLK